LRAIHIVPGVAEEASGPTYSVMRLTQALRDEGHSIELAALDLPGTQHPSSLVRTFPLGFGPQRLGRSPAMYRWLRDECASGRAAIVHNHGMWQMNSIYPARAIRGTRARLLQSTRGAFTEWAMQWGSRVKPAFWRLLQRPAMERVHCFHATAPSEYDDIRRLGFRQPVAIIPNGIDIPDQTPKQNGDSRTLLFLGRIHPNKGLDLLIPAWRAIQDRFPFWRLRIVGNDNDGYQARMEQLVREIGAERVTFDGPAYGAAKTAAYQNADLFVLPTYSENFGMSVAEALAAGTPVVVTKGAPWQELAEVGAGWWIDIGVEPLATTLAASMSRAPSDLFGMGARGREWMVRSFAWPDIARRMTITYEWLLGTELQPSWVISD
jgi:glycosyltransferase involved in cell wall biosynthesis